MSVLVEIAFEPVQHVVRRSDTRSGRGLGGADRAVAGTAQEHHRAIPRRDAGCLEVLDESVVVPTIGTVPFDVDDLAIKARQIGHPDEPPLGVGTTVDQHSLGILGQQLPCLLRRDVSVIAHDLECPKASWAPGYRPSMPRPRVRMSYLS